MRSRGRVLHPEGPASAKALRLDLLNDKAMLRSELTVLGDNGGEDVGGQVTQDLQSHGKVFEF